MLLEKLCRRGVAQMVARMVRDHEVVGSNPVTPTKLRKRAQDAPFFHVSDFGHLRQSKPPLKERNLPPFR